MKLDIRDFGEFEAALAELVTSHVTSIMRAHKITQYYDGENVEEWLTAYINTTLEYIRTQLHGQLQEVDPAHLTAGHDIAVTMPRISRTPDNEDDESPYICTLFDDSDIARETISDELEKELHRTMRLTLSFRFVRKSQLHTFLLANVNAVLEEVGEHYIEAGEEHTPFSVYEPDDPDDETLKRPDVTKDWTRNYMLVGDRFMLGRVATLTETDIYRALEEDSEFSMMMRSALGLGTEKIDNIEILGTLNVRVYDQGVREVNLA